MRPIRMPAMGLISSAVLLTGLISGCQTAGHSPSVNTAHHAGNKAPEQRVYLRLYDEQKAQGRGVTLVAKNEALQKAIRHAFPDAPIAADGSVNMNQPVDVWANRLTPGAFLDHLGSQANLVIAKNGRGTIELRSNDQWAFSLPDDVAGTLMPQALRIASSNGVQAVQMGDHEEILLLSGKPDDMSRTRRALGQLHDRVQLERTLAPLSTR